MSWVCINHYMTMHHSLQVYGFIFLLNSEQPEILAGIKFGSWALNCHLKNIGGFKFGGSDCHMYLCKYEKLAEFNLAVAN